MNPLTEEPVIGAPDRLMLATGSSARPDGAPGRLSQMLLRLLMRRATVAATERLADHFKLITLEGPGLEGVAWTPGQKIQIAMGSAFVARTYTPIEWNMSTGRACILAFEHGDGPGSAWVRRVAPGDECDLFGPRPSIDLRRATGPIAVFGDETSIGLACALTYQDRARPVTSFLEVGDLAAAREVLAQLDVEHATLFAGRDDEAHLDAMEAAIPALLADGVSFVLTGRAGAVQRLRHSLRRHAVPGTSIFTKAYWAPGKTGLD